MGVRSRKDLGLRTGLGVGVVIGDRAENGIDVVKDGVGIGTELGFKIRVGMVLATAKADAL